ncbi:peptidylprolyl isomerase [Ramlibacter albus]|uniref:Chaperone SurA n=1 Tax=Ramlibacter albus TaxID=2079448 RepID=A0A923M6J0_9BURK|nr:peptidylprolyl isomerase [Ramlibacter albus]MBC5763719.1 peptidylprolyl isomerase [Ramlibacter albus]
MKARSLALWLACAALAELCLPAYAQLRAAPQLNPFLPPPDSRPRAADYIVAVVNSEPITNNEVRSRMIRFEQQLAQQGSPMPPRAELARQVLERLIAEKAQIQLARENGIRAEEGMVDNAEQNVARQNQMSVDELRKRLKADGIDVALFREDLRNQILLSRLRDRELESRVRVSEFEIDQFLREQQGQAGEANMEINLAHILVAVPEKATGPQVAALQQRAMRLQERAKAGEDFVKLARESSDAQGASNNGGVIGLRTADRYPPLFVQATRDLRPGGVSEVVRSEAGFHIVKVLEKRQGGVPGVNVTQTHARHILLRPSAELTEAQAKARLEDVRKRVEAKQADFAEVAKQISQDASARNGGDLGWANPGLFVPEFEDVLNQLTPGQVSEPVVTRFGVHLIQLLERRQSQLSQREQRDIARGLVRERKLDEAYATWAQEVRGRAYVEYREPPQ